MEKFSRGDIVRIDICAIESGLRPLYSHLNHVDLTVSDYDGQMVNVIASDNNARYQLPEEYLRLLPQSQVVTAPAPKATTTQVGGSHYLNMKIQPIEFIMANNLDFCVGNAIKYLCRYKQKNGEQDLMKARHYIDLLIENEYHK
jgi:hypothetical protein